MYKVTGWWAYELCTAARSVRQFHARQDGHVEVEYTLGQGLADTWLAADHVGERYGDGTPCDLTGEPRSVDVHYACDASRDAAFIAHVTEPRSCHYVLHVRTPHLCAHAHFGASRRAVNELRCERALGAAEIDDDWSLDELADATEMFDHALLAELAHDEADDGALDADSLDRAEDFDSTVRALRRRGRTAVRRQDVVQQDGLYGAALHEVLRELDGPLDDGTLEEEQLKHSRSRPGAREPAPKSTSKQSAGTTKSVGGSQPNSKLPAATKRKADDTAPADADDKVFEALHTVLRKAKPEMTEFDVRQVLGEMRHQAQLVASSLREKSRSEGDDEALVATSHIQMLQAHLSNSYGKKLNLNAEQRRQLEGVAKQIAVSATAKSAALQKEKASDDSAQKGTKKIAAAQI